MERKRILIADGDREVGGSICEFLKSDYQVFYVSDGREILPAIRDKKVDLLLTDLDVPNVYIYHLLSEVKEKYPGLPVALMYVYCDYTQEMEKTIRRMADAIFLKPFDMEEVKRRIDGLLRGSLQKSSMRSQPNSPGTASNSSRSDAEVKRK